VTSTFDPELSRHVREQTRAIDAAEELLRFITCGSVDDGKSTLLGRLLLEAGAIYDDQIAALRQDSDKHGTTGDELDTALLLDGLEDERQQGITIDVAYRYFNTPKRKFIIADTPGHEQFTRNMVTGASTADLAIILVDASKGILTQTKRHAFLVSLLGLKHVILAVNKMDLVAYERDVFERLRNDFTQFASKLEFPDVRFVPLSALKGDNVSKHSARTPWYTDGPLLHLLETIYVGSDRNVRDLRFPVQWVNRPNASFRGFSGTVASGTLRVGERVMVLPSRTTTRIDRIVTMDGDLVEATAQQSVTVTLEDEVDVTRGDMIVRPDNLPNVSRVAEAMVVWMSEQPLVPGKWYWVKHGTRKTSGEVQSLRYRIDVNSLHRHSAPTLKLNEIGRCRIVLHDPVMFDSYRRNRQTGSFIVVDRITHETIAAGMFLDQSTDATAAAHWDDEPAGQQLVRAESRIGANERYRRYAQKPATVLLTGLSGAGKTTIVLALEQRLFKLRAICVVLDGQNMRFGISRDLGFSAEERSENLRRAAEVAKLINDAGLLVVAAFVAPHEEVREKVKQLIGEDRFLHVHLAASVDVCRKRDSSGRYAAADRGDIADFPGVTSMYEEPRKADLILQTETLSADQCADEIMRLLSSGGFLPSLQTATMRPPTPSDPAQAKSGEN
jgi:bifunctional enzyme CysN/CysC